MRSEPQNTTICAIVTSPSSFHRRAVRFRAHVESDGFENTVLVDPRCPNAGIAPNWGRHSGENVSVLVDALYGKRPGTRDKEVEAVFIGTFILDEKLRIRRLEVASVADLKIKPRVAR